MTSSDYELIDAFISRKPLKVKDPIPAGRGRISFQINDDGELRCVIGKTEKEIERPGEYVSLPYDSEREYLTSFRIWDAEHALTMAGYFMDLASWMLINQNEGGDKNS